MQDLPRVAVVPSNQYYQKYAGQVIDGRTVTEEDWALLASAACVDELERLGWEARVFHVPGEPVSPTDELEEALNSVVLWKPDVVISIHSTQGSRNSKPAVRALYAHDDLAWAWAMTEDVAGQLGIPAQDPMWRDQLVFYTVLDAGGFEGKALLLEIGQHSIPRYAAWNLEHAAEEGQAVARALLHTLPTNITGGRSAPISF